VQLNADENRLTNYQDEPAKIFFHTAVACVVIRMWRIKKCSGQQEIFAGDHGKSSYGDIFSSRVYCAGQIIPLA